MNLLKPHHTLPCPKHWQTKKAIINVQNDNDRCLEWALKSATCPAKNNVSNKYSYTKCPDLNMDGIDFPTPISQIPRVEKQNNLAINVYGTTVSSKLKTINVFPSHISEQPNERQRINLLLLSEDDEENPTEKIKSTKYHYCWIKKSQQTTI